MMNAILRINVLQDAFAKILSSIARDRNLHLCRKAFLQTPQNCKYCSDLYN